MAPFPSLSPAAMSRLLLVFSQFLLISCRCHPQGDYALEVTEAELVERTTPRDPNATESSEYVFSPERDYVNKDEVAAMITDDSRPEEVPPFADEEALWNTPSTPESPWKRAKNAVKRLFGLHKTTEKPPWNVTREELGDYLIRKAKTFHHYIKYTLLKKPLPNVTQPAIIKDPDEFWSAHYTDWKYFNQLHFELMNSSNPENHWFYRKVMKEGYGVNLDAISTTTPMPFDIHRMDGFSTNVTLPTTMDGDLDSEVDSAEFHPSIRAMLTIRPELEEALDKWIGGIEISTIPPVEINDDQPLFANLPLYKKLQKKMASFYMITTRDPDEWMDSHELKKSKKLKKWLEKEEKRLDASVERHINNYTMDFGPRYNSWWENIGKHYTSEIWVEQNTEKQQVEQDEQTRFVPEFVRQGISEGRVVNVTNLERWLWHHCSNNTIPWTTEAPLTKPPKVFFEERTDITEKIEKNKSPADIVTVPDTLLQDNRTIDTELVNKMFENAQIHLRNLSLLRIEENWQRISQAMHEARFTTQQTIDYDHAHDMFTHKMGNY